jgi:hypothetical protein
MRTKTDAFQLLASLANSQPDRACPDRRNSSYPFLDVRSPDGEEYVICFQDFEQTPELTQIAIGRCGKNDIVLPDPYKKVSRRHCVIEREGDRWWLVDEDSANGTFLRQEGGSEVDVRAVDVRSVDKILLQDGDVILILGKLTASKQPVFWQLMFHDPNVTDRVEDFQALPEIEYDLSQQRLFKVTRQRQSEIKLSPQERKLIHYMAQRNQNNNGQPTVCGYEELIKAIWQEPYERISDDITHLVWRIRAEIERDSGEPRFLKTVRKQGYLLNIRIQ